MNYDDIHICYQIVLVVCISLCILLLGKESPWNEEIHISWGKRSTQRVKHIKIILDSLQKTGFSDILTKNRGLWSSPSQANTVRKRKEWTWQNIQRYYCKATCFAAAAAIVLFMPIRSVFCINNLHQQQAKKCFVVSVYPECIEPR